MCLCSRTLWISYAGTITGSSPFCVVQRIVLAPGSPDCHEKEIHCSNYPLTPAPLPGNTIACYCRWNCSDGGGKRWREMSDNPAFTHAPLRCQKINRQNKMTRRFFDLFNTAHLWKVWEAWRERLRLTDGTFTCSGWRYSTLKLRPRETDASWSAHSSTSISLPLLFCRSSFKNYPDFQLNQSCLWLQIMSTFTGLQMNTVAAGLLSVTQPHHADTLEEGSEVFAFRD